MKRHLLSLTCVIVTLLSQWPQLGAAQTQLAIQRLGAPKTQPTNVGGSPAIALDVPFVAQDPQGAVSNEEVERVSLKIGNDTYTGGVLKPVTSQELQLAVVLDTSGTLNEANFKRTAAALGQTIGRVGNSLVSVYGIADQINYSKEKQKDLKVFETEMAAIANKAGSKLCLNTGVARALSQLEGAPAPRAVLIITNGRESGCGSDSTQNIVNFAMSRQIPIFAISTSNGVSQADLDQYAVPTSGLSILGDVNNPEYALIKMLPVFRAQTVARFNVFPKEKPQKADLMVRFKNGLEATHSFSFEYSGGPFQAPPRFELAGVVGSMPIGVRFNLNITNKDALKALEVSVKDPLTGENIATQPLDSAKNDFAKNIVPFPNLRTGKKYQLTVAGKNNQGNEVGRIGPIEFTFEPQLPTLSVLDIKPPDSSQPDLQVKLKIDDPEGISSYRVFLQNEQNVIVNGSEVVSERVSDYFVLPTYSKLGLAQGKYKVVAEGRYSSDVQPVRVVSQPFDYVPVGGSAVFMAWVTNTLRDSPLIAVGILGVVVFGMIGLFAILRLSGRSPKIGPREVAMGVQNKPVKPKMVQIPQVGDSQLSGGSSLPTSTVTLTLVEPAGNAFNLSIQKSPFSVGRDAAAQGQIRVDKSLGVSSVHATFIYTNNAWHIRDDNSTNGTFVNGRKLAKGEQVMLDKGSIIGFGPRVKMRFNSH
ncbi:MAG: FHA domain-containing protein [Anaerolineae bacterium]|nr:FHA domain-containing protein [Anaerolineae bacterium]